MSSIVIGNLCDHITSNNSAHKGDQVARKLVIKEKELRMDRNKNRIHNRKLRNRSEFCAGEEFSRRKRRHQYGMDTVEDLIPREGSYHRGRHQHMQTEEGLHGSEFRHRVRPAQRDSQPERGMRERKQHRFFTHPEPFISPRDLMHEKWMLEMRIFRLKKRLHRINHRLRKQF